MSATRSWLELASDHLLPVVAINVKNMHIIHPMDAIISSKVDNFRVDEATCSGDTGAWLIPIDYGLHPCEGLSVEVKDIV